MAHWCESCGQKLPDGEIPANATWLGNPGDDPVHPFAKPIGAKKSGRERKIVLAVAGVLAVWGAFVMVGRATSPDDAIDQQASAEIEAARLEREAEAAAAAEAGTEAAADQEGDVPEIADVDGDYGPADAAPNFPDATLVEAGRRSSVQVERLQRQLTRRDSSAFVAYRAREGVVLIDLVHGDAVVNELGSDVVAVEPGARLLRSGAASFSIDPTTLELQRVGDDSSVVLSDTLDGNIYLVDASALSGQASTIGVIVQGEYREHLMPTGGFQLLPVDGLGLLAVPKGPTGETLIAGVDSFTTLSENRVLTGTADALLEQVCSSESNCSLLISNLATGDRTEVPASFIRFGDRYSLAPDGSSLLRYSPEGFAEVFTAANDSISWVIGAGMRGPAWGPNSDFIAWIDRIGEPKLKVMFPDERDWLTIDLSDFGAPPPASEDLIVFTGPAATVES